MKKNSHIVKIEEAKCHIRIYNYNTAYFYKCK